MSLKVVADEKIPFLAGVLEPFLDIRYMPGSKISNTDIRDADALLIRTRTKCNAELLEGSAVKFIATATIGFDHIDTAYCQRNGITWTNAPGCNSGSVMQYVAAALLWYAQAENIRLSERVIGIVGVGNVGKKVLKLAEALDMQIVLNDPPLARSAGACGFVSLEGILREADIITLHVPLNMHGQDKTYHLMDERILERLNSKTILINTSRGEVLDTGFAKQALASGRLSALLLDVWENEPDIDRDLLNNTHLATPHIAGYSVDGKANGTKMSVQALSRFYDLGIDDWEPNELPQPETPNLHFDSDPGDFQQVLTELVLQTYDIKRDDSWLRRDATKFEEYRGKYPLRREFSAYSVIGKFFDEPSKRKLRRLGFELLPD